MKYLICLGHPAQYHVFKNIILQLRINGHKIKLLITSKDILKDLCKQGGFEYEILPSRSKNSKVTLVFFFLKRYFEIFKRIRKFKPDLLLGSEITLPLLGKTFRIPSIVFSEDDAKIIPQFVKLAYPFASTILSPSSCNAGKWEYKKIGYNGFQKLIYLHPTQFTPSNKNIEHLIKERFFILRFAKLSAYHDSNRCGIDTQIAQNLIDILKPFGNIYISAERELEPQFEKYRISINPLDMHSMLSYADLYIGDSQSMAVESAILGTPGIRFNGFVGQIGVLEELEHKYNLAFGIKPKEHEKLYNKVKELVGNPNLKNEYRLLQRNMLNEKINVLAFMLWFIQNYPGSTKIINENPDYQYNFK